MYVHMSTIQKLQKQVQALRPAPARPVTHLRLFNSVRCQEEVRFRDCAAPFPSELLAPKPHLRLPRGGKNSQLVKAELGNPLVQGGPQAVRALSSECHYLSFK